MTPLPPSSAQHKFRRKRIEAFKTLIRITGITSTLFVIVLVLLQHGKGVDTDAAFGSGSGSTQGIFGPVNNANFLSRSTAVAATSFSVTCMVMVYTYTHSDKCGLDFSDARQIQQAPKPITPAQNDTTLIAPNLQQQQDNLIHADMMKLVDTLP